MGKKKKSVVGIEPVISFSRDAKIWDVSDRENPKGYRSEEEWLAFQFITDRDKAKIRRFVNLIYDEVLVDGNDLFEKAQKVADSDDLTGVVFDCLARKALEVANHGEINSDGGRHVAFTTSREIHMNQTLKICLFLLSPKFVGFNLADCGLKPHVTEKVLLCIGEQKKILKRVSKRAQAVSRDSLGITDIAFFHAEYSKRQFLIDLQADEDLACDVRKASAFLGQMFNECMIGLPEICDNCPWTIKKDQTSDIGSILLKGAVCGSRCCKFNGRISQMVDCFGVSQGYESVGYRSELQAVDSIPPGLMSAEGLVSCFRLAKRYGLYPYDLLVIPPVTLYVKEGTDMPNPNSFAVKRSVVGSGGSEFIHTVIRQAFREVISSRAHSGYREENENRLIGLWIWDQLHMEQKADNLTLTDVIRQLFDSKELSHYKWYKETGAGRMAFVKTDKGELEVNDEEGPLENHQRHYTATAMGIQHGRLLSIRSAEELAKQERYKE